MFITGKKNNMTSQSDAMANRVVGVKAGREEKKHTVSHLSAALLVLWRGKDMTICWEVSSLISC